MGDTHDSHTPFLRIIAQRHTMDCAVACLAMLLDVTYEAALLAVKLPQNLQHLVVLKEGLIVDTDSIIWEADVFLAAFKGRAMSLLVLKN